MKNPEVKEFQNTVKFLTCSCANSYQDQAYGLRMRVHNKVMGNDGKGKGWRCTVCKAIKA